MVAEQADRPIEVLLVEDNPADARLAQDTIEQSGHQVNITHVEDGEDALSVLRREGEHSDAARPDLILLDLRLPKKDGIEVLADLSQDESLVSIPVMLLTATEAEASLLGSYSIPPSRYARKPLRLEHFKQGAGPTWAVQQPAYPGPGRSAGVGGGGPFCGSATVVVALRLGHWRPAQRPGVATFDPLQRDGRSRRA